MPPQYLRAPMIEVYTLSRELFGAFKQLLLYTYNNVKAFKKSFYKSNIA